MMTNITRPFHDDKHCETSLGIDPYWKHMLLATLKMLTVRNALCDLTICFNGTKKCSPEFSKFLSKFQPGFWLKYVRNSDRNYGSLTWDAWKIKFGRRHRDPKNTNTWFTPLHNANEFAFGVLLYILHFRSCRPLSVTVCTSHLTVEYHILTSAKPNEIATGDSPEGCT